MEDQKLHKVNWHRKVHETRGYASWGAGHRHLIAWAAIHEKGERFLLTVWWPERQGVPPGKHEVYPAGWSSNYVSVESSHRSEDLAKGRAEEIVLGIHERVVEARRAELLKELAALEA